MSGEGFAARLLDRPGRTAAWFILLHTAVWWLVPHLAQANLPLDVIEQIAWAREPQWLYHKHPPLPAWLLAGADALSGGAPWAIQLLTPLALALGFWAVWRLGSTLLSPARALVALLLLEGVTFFSFQAAEFNHNSVQVPLWALCGLALWRGLTRDRLHDWALLGIWAALALYGKYFAGFLLLALLLFLVFEPTARRCWRRPGPYVTAAVLALLLLPHLLALVRLDFLPLSYAMERTTPAGDWLQRLWFPLEFGLAQAIGVGGTLLAVCLLPRGGQSLLPPEPLPLLPRRYLVTLAFLPLALVLLASLLLGAEFRALWGMPLWIFLPLGLFAIWPMAIASKGLVRALAVVLLVGIGSAAFYLGYLVYPAVTGRVARVDFPGPQLAAVARQRWEAAEGRPVAFVAGPVWEAGNVAFYGSRDALVIIDGDLAKSYWLTPAELARAGVLLVWPQGHDASGWIAGLQAATGLSFHDLGEITLPWQRGGARIEPLTFHLGALRRISGQ